MAYIVLSAYEQGITGFWHLFLNAFIINLGWNFGDFFLLDWWLRAVYTDRVSLPENRNVDEKVRHYGPLGKGACLVCRAFCGLSGDWPAPDISFN